MLSAQIRIGSAILAQGSKETGPSIGPSANLMWKATLST